MYTEYFKEIFETSKTVIIPGLGSFSKASSTDSKISFNPYLKFNDGFLASFIAKKQGTSIDEAHKSITENVEKINSALNQKGEAVVLGLGTLKKSADGKIEFISGNIPVEAVVKPLPETKPVVEPVKPIVEKQPEIVKPISEPVVESIKPIVEKQPEIVKPIPAPVVEKEVKKVLQPEIKQEPKKEEIKPVAEIKSNTGQKEVNTVAPPLTEVNQQKNKTKVKPVKEKKEKKEKRKFPIWLMILLALLLGGGTFTAIKWDMVKGWFVAGETKNETNKDKASKTNGDADKDKTNETEAQTEEALIDTFPAKVTKENTENVAQETKQETTTVHTAPPVNNNVNNATSTAGNYHIIVNCYTMPENATKMVEKLNAEGHQATNLGLRGGYYVVSAGSFSTAEEANAKLQAIQNTYPKAWVYNGQ